MGSTLHNLTHSFSTLTHSFSEVNKGSEQGFYWLSTAFASSYYYYLYIYKSRSQADRFLITVRSEKNRYKTRYKNLIKNNMSARATA